MTTKQTHRIGLRACAALVAATLLPVAHAQYDPGSPGWLKTRSGSTVDGSSSLSVRGNRADAEVSATGGQASVGANIGGRFQMNAAAHVNSINLAATAADNAQIAVLNNQAVGFVSASGGSANANSVLLFGGEGHKALTASTLSIQNSTASNVRSVGAGADMLLGAASVQMPGQASANAMLITQADVRSSRLTSRDNVAANLNGFGGSALGNTVTVQGGSLDNVQVGQHHNTAKGVTSGGGSAEVGWSAVASVTLQGLSVANSVLSGGGNLKSVVIDQAHNIAKTVRSIGGSALANSVNFAGEVKDYRGTMKGNRATDIEAHGAEASLGGGLLADVKVAAVALANSVSILGSTTGSQTEHRLIDNVANGVGAAGGGAAANSIWLDNAKSEGSKVFLSRNTANGVSTAGGSGSIMGGWVGSVERNGRAIANSVAFSDGGVLSNSPLTLQTNQADGVRGSGGVAAANSVLAPGGTLDGSRIALLANRASRIDATGFQAEAVKGALYSASKNSLALANGIGVFRQSSITSPSIVLDRNTASDAIANGGTINANAVHVEDGSRLSASVDMRGNAAVGLSTAAGSSSGVAGATSSKSRARAAANSLVLAHSANVDNLSASWLGNHADRIGASGGTALVNSVGAYSQASVSGGSLLLANNIAADISAGGNYSQTMGIGGARNGILVANGIYLEGDGAVHLNGTSVALNDNVVRTTGANGGRVNANALSINGSGNLAGGTLVLARNQASNVHSEGDQNTVLGHAVGGGFGIVNANAVQIYGALMGGRLDLVDNVVSAASSSRGTVVANSVLVDAGGVLENSSLRLASNTTEQASAGDGKMALDNAFAGKGRMTGSDAFIENNTARVTDEGAANSVFNDGTIENKSQLRIVRNHGTVDKGIASSVVNHGRIASSRIAVLNNYGTASAGAVVNSVLNLPGATMENADVTISQNIGSATGSGSFGGRGKGAIANSVVNAGKLRGKVVIANNTGAATGNGVINSLVNTGTMSGTVRITGNRGTAGSGEIANSVINRGNISGTVSIIGKGGGDGSNIKRGGGGGNIVRNSITILPPGG